MQRGKMVPEWYSFVLSILGVSLLTENIRKKATLVIKGLLRNLDWYRLWVLRVAGSKKSRKFELFWSGAGGFGFRCLGYGV